jgi:xanthine dehydrogenase accessory factor
MKQNEFQDLLNIEKGLEHGERIILFRILDQNSQQWTRLVLKEEELEGFKYSSRLPEGVWSFVRESIKGLLTSGKPADIIANVDLTNEKYAIEVLTPKVKLFVFGAGHVGQAVAQIGVLLGYDVVLIDDRPEFVKRSRIADSRIHLLVGEFKKIIEISKFGYNSAIVIVTRGHQYDEVCLRGTLRSSASYLGMIGSKRRVVSVINRLKSDGFTEREFKKLHAPIGLQIGAKSPQEIAVAILAEIIGHFNRDCQEFA